MLYFSNFNHLPHNAATTSFPDLPFPVISPPESSAPSDVLRQLSKPLLISSKMFDHIIICFKNVSLPPGPGEFRVQVRPAGNGTHPSWPFQTLSSLYATSYCVMKLETSGPSLQTGRKYRVSCSPWLHISCSNRNCFLDNGSADLKIWVSFYRSLFGIFLETSDYTLPKFLLVRMSVSKQSMRL